MIGKINKVHRYLIRENATRTYVGSADDLGECLPDGHMLIDTRGEDDLGPGIRDFLRRTPSRAAGQPTHTQDRGGRLLACFPGKGAK
jgi:hypothetical protein